MSVSVIIPCYKDAATLGKALASVYAQTHRVDEIVVVNDASPETDAIELVLQSHPDVIYIVNPVNLGLAATRNVGVRNASTDIITFLDADDELHPQKIELQLDLYKVGRVIACAAKRVSIDRESIESVRYTDGAPYRQISMSIGSLLRNDITGAAMMISRELFNSMGGYDETLLSCEDFDFWLRLLSEGVEVLDIKLPLYLYKINPYGLSNNVLRISYWELEVVKKFFNNNRKVGAFGYYESVILTVWLIRHCVRYRLCGDVAYKDAIEKNIILLERRPFARGVLILFKWLRLDSVLAALLRGRSSVKS